MMIAMPRTLSRLTMALILLGLPTLASAQSISLPGNILPDEQQSQGTPDQVQEGPRADWRSANYGPVPQQQLDSATEALPPFGANLFEGGFRGTRADGLNPGYTIKPGDEVTLRAWGAAEIDRVMPVDAQGNIFIPAIGPLRVQGSTSQQLDAKVRQAIKQVYPEDVEVYTNLQGVQPVGVFVTGYVENPGRYAGTPSDSALYFLDQAGGIDQALGSYRRIRVVRDGRTLDTLDLYDFLLDGQLPRPQFRDGDTIVVEERGPAIAVVGDVQREYRYELRGDKLTGGEVIRLARLQSGVSHVLLRGSRDEGPIARYFPLNAFSGQTVRSGDEVLFSVDQRDETIVVELEGSYYGPSRYALPRDARLGELLDAIAVPKEMTAVESISLKRESVAKQQRQSLQESLRRLETTYLGASSATNEEAQIRVREAEMIQQFVERARDLEPSGRLVVAHDGPVSDIRLQDGDVITIPEVSDSILISGEVVVPQAVVYRPGMSAMDYIEGAGGVTQRGDDDHILVVRQNGAVRNADDVALRPGDEILVMPEVPTKNLQLATSLTQILYQIAVATKVAVDL
ncbi:polysaccharide biosynthesis/export family protein [Halomonas sp. EGI 63088]|uniref:Polysaccharide biosynthesis/export family protein n=1 Tax=Halomonas flagellata TaxID=2920385 RepID=A0ABS9RYW3_9GAMM|nr:polysaccharide biosynthesis/export family protein [Halomonas flagellata]MCH4565047.1 polysaccharide biosynthesis/export family protein [Halomonas flagellata]